ncbi:homoserine kinase [Levilactobacillus tujiorum]|uniref:Homoserine kinase n=1 Tax=Levilactobacillus tujiorum TaxID=2912243 RepID=A0ABX1L7I2_9LACO|nr:homoserine kinase [Levilactobacillus tujiorum]MCH5464892.1 homoserine kinase [Levilactobacillus tujiorum]NLR11953.1 homoserine kinase [Lactobacillus sp. HBUAS51387]NLR29927.1 homoserine kinase [Levilactobacillus tujiorum]NLR31352.1 homoserine kinase [Levilactobacillus tujiorum]
MGKTIIRVPATSANLGPGIDSIGAALHLYLTVIIEEKTEKWRVNHALGTSIPRDENNLMVQTALKVNPKLQAHQLTVMSDIPVSRGLGSSTSAVIAGIKIANELGEMDLSIADQLNWAVKLGGELDNVAPALMGQAAVATVNDGVADAIKLPLPDLQALVFIPGQKLLAQKSRKALPKQVSFDTAVHASSVANVLVAALLKEDWELATKLIEMDEFHEQARSQLVPELNQIRDAAHELGIVGTYLSGAGPTVVTFGTSAQLTLLRTKLADADLPGSLRILELDKEGATVLTDA